MVGSPIKAVFHLGTLDPHISLSTPHMYVCIQLISSVKNNFSKLLRVSSDSFGSLTAILPFWFNNF